MSKSMEKQTNTWKPGRCLGTKTKPSLRRCLLTALSAAVAAINALLPSAQAAPVTHGISAANINVVQNDTGNTTASVTVTTPLAINDFRIRDGSNRGDFDIQIGPDPTDDAPNGVLMSCIA